MLSKLFISVLIFVYFGWGFGENFLPDVTFGIVDLKYNDHDGIKICELGEGVFSGFTGYDRLHCMGAMDKQLINHLRRLYLPVFFVNKLSAICEPLKTLPDIRKAFLKRIKDQPGFHEEWERDLKIPLCYPDKFFDYKGIVISYNPHLEFGISMQQLREANKDFLFLSDTSRRFFPDKYYTHLLFHKDPELLQFRPRYKILPKKYSPTLAREIINELKCNIFVIKPLHAWKGRGIIIVDKKLLDTSLKKILCDVNTLDKKMGDEYRYWRQDKERSFLIEQFITSQSIILEGKQYDPTMRVAFLLKYDQGEMIVDFLGAYWKLPSYALDENNDLILTHKSYIGPKCHCSAVVERSVFMVVSNILRCILPKIYLKILECKAKLIGGKDFRAITNELS